MRFDYLHSARPLFLQRILEFRIPERMHGALFAVTGASAIVFGAWCIETYRLREALRIQAVYQARYDAAQTQLKKLQLYRDRVQTLVDLDRRVRRIAASGEADARSLAEIANDLPRHAWLTGISRDAVGFSLAGRARDLGVLSGVMHALMRAKRLHNPTLVSAAAETERGRDAGVNYEIHVDEAAR